MNNLTYNSRRFKTAGYPYEFINRQSVKVRINPDGKKCVAQLAMMELKANLNDVKKVMDKMEGEDEICLKEILTHVHPHSGSKNKIEDIRVNGENATNAWVKMWETMKDFNIFPNTGKEYKIFCNAELPGAFIFAINHWAKTHKIAYDWCANSILQERIGGSVENIKYLDDENGLLEKYPGKWLMNDRAGKPVNDGDITKEENRKYIYERVGNKMDIYTSDLGFEIKLAGNDPDSKNLYNDQEILHYNAHVAAAICGVTSLAVGGLMICKSYTFFEKKTFSFWQSQIFPLFRECFVYKPSASRMANSECYFVCRGLKRTISFKDGENLADFDDDLCVHEDLYAAAKLIYGNQMKKLTEVYKIMDDVKFGKPKPTREIVKYTSLGIKKLPETDKLIPNFPSTTLRQDETGHYYPQPKINVNVYINIKPNVYVPPHKRGGLSGAHV